ncbi:MAG: NFACT RNA binding domain-containing protein [Candidatus Aenigmatarchaeota archaeon]
MGKKWYERYYWFFSSNNILVLVGKNPRNDETILKRFTRDQDLVLHSDLVSRFAVIRNDANQVLPAETIYEAAVFLACYSEAWEKKLEKEKIDVFYVRPEQVKKRDNSVRGVFDIVGEKKYLKKIEPRLSIGIKQEEVFNAKLIYGPPTAVKAHTPYMVTLIPGDFNARALAKDIKRELLLKVCPEISKTTEAIDLKEIEKIIPFNMGELLKI